jgi:hypothetical protein
LFKTFILGLALGLAGAYALLYFVPVVDQHRESSYVTVQPNGGNAESFHINLPRDRILVGMPGVENSTPAGVDWPQDPIFDGSQAEVFKLRDKNNAVVGIASRIASSAESTGAFIQWVLHLPARGTMYLTMQLEPSAEGYRAGQLSAGTEEFAELTGRVQERFNTQVEADEDETSARIQLLTSLVGQAELTQ